MAKHLSNSLGFGLAYKFDTQTVPGNKNAVEKTLGLPFLSDTAGRFLKVTNTGEFEDARRVGDAADVGASRTLLDKQEAIIQSVNDVDKPSWGDALRLYRKLVAAGGLRQGLGVENPKAFVAEYMRFADRKTEDPYFNAIVFARNDDVKAALLRHYEKTLPKDEYDKIVGNLLMQKNLGPVPFVESKMKRGGKP